MRTEKDNIGEVSIPSDALYGIHSFRARQNFPSQVTFPLEWFRASGMVKLACYRAIRKLRKALQKEHPDMIDHFRLKGLAPDVPVFANIGGVQLRDRDNRKLIELIRKLEVDAIAVHLNAGQELSQPEGDRDFRGVLAGIAALCEKCPVSVNLQEAEELPTEKI